MRVLPTTFNGNITLNVRNHTGTNYLFLLLEEQTNLFTTYDVTGSVENAVLTFPIELVLKADIYYMGFVYPRFADVGTISGTITEWWDNYQDTINSGVITDDVCRFKIFSTNQTDLNKYFFNEGQYIEPSGYVDDEVIIVE
jgi:hypothetical protein